jgi:hypothetical protein
MPEDALSFKRGDFVRSKKACPEKSEWWDE